MTSSDGDTEASSGGVDANTAGKTMMLAPAAQERWRNSNTEIFFPRATALPTSTALAENILIGLDNSCLLRYFLHKYNTRISIQISTSPSMFMIHITAQSGHMIMIIQNCVQTLYLYIPPIPIYVRIKPTITSALVWSPSVVVTMMRSAWGIFRPPVSVPPCHLTWCNRWRWRIHVDCVHFCGPVTAIACVGIVCSNIMRYILLLSLSVCWPSGARSWGPLFISW